MNADERAKVAAVFAGSTRSPEHLTFLAEPVIDQIAEARVRAALEAVAREIEQRPGCACRDSYCGIRNTTENIAAIVRTAIPPDPTHP